ncbi:putative copia-type protein [Trifolium pratense]|uniref:Putative copia-type protein n=1 Tax=Trifolium pratense TaxID=57577 RepID=A0A2K3L1T5_TRIPR|nr:putative copia-type protein [Trifolium pratense]
MRPLRYFLGIEAAQSSPGIAINQLKYALDILSETSMLDCRPIDTHMDPNVKLLPGQWEPLKDPGRYRRLVGKLNYLTATRPDITFVVSTVSQFLNSHWNAVVRILRYLKNAPGRGLLHEDKGDAKITCYSDADWAGSPSDRRSTSGYCVLIGGNMISWRNKKQNTVPLSSVEAGYRAMGAASKEIAWLRKLLLELKLGDLQATKLICDNQAALHIASNPVFHERTKHIEIDCHYV